MTRTRRARSSSPTCPTLVSSPVPALPPLRTHTSPGRAWPTSADRTCFFLCLCVRCSDDCRPDDPLLGHWACPVCVRRARQGHKEVKGCRIRVLRHARGRRDCRQGHERRIVRRWKGEETRSRVGRKEGQSKLTTSSPPSCPAPSSSVLHPALAYEHRIYPPYSVCLSRDPS